MSGVVKRREKMKCIFVSFEDLVRSSAMFFFGIEAKSKHTRQRTKRQKRKMSEMNGHAQRQTEALCTEKNDPGGSFPFFLLQSAGTFGRLATRKTFERTHTHSYEHSSHASNQMNKEKKKRKEETLYID